MPSTFLIGNDVVDLGDPRCIGKSEEDRFVQRVCTPDEILAIHASPSPDIALWMLWAAKEATFKLAFKLHPTSLAFVHRSFHIQLPDPGDRLPRGPQVGESLAEYSLLAAEPAKGSARDATRTYPIHFHVTRELVHALAWHPDVDPPVRDHAIAHSVHRLPTAEGDRPCWREALFPRFSPREWESVHSAGSAYARLHVRAAAAKRLGVPEESIEVVCERQESGRAPPGLLVAGHGVDLDVSLSHHGRFVAWALAS